MKIAIIGMHYGDEGKGRIVYHLARKADVVERYQGGANAGHTVWIDDNKYVFHLIPSGILCHGVYNIIGDGVYLDPERLVSEIKELINRGVDISPKKLGISGNAHITFQYHRELDGFQEKRKEDEGKQIGSTQSGISPTAADKMNRTGLRFAEFFDEDIFKDVVFRNLDEKSSIMRQGGMRDTLIRYKELYKEAREMLSPFLMDEVDYFHKNADKNWLFEGAQGTFLDVDFGTYPYITASNPTVKGIPHPTDKRIGVVKFYMTRVGEGPFITRYESKEMEERIREKGEEKGATTGRARKCGHFDAVLAKRATMINHLTGIAITKGDVLAHEGQIKICVAYELNGIRLSDEDLGKVLANRNLYSRCKPVYETFSGWEKIIENEKIVKEAHDYITAIGKLTGCPVNMVSYGKEDNEIEIMEEPFEC